MTFQEQLPLWKEFRRARSPDLRKRLWECNLGLAYQQGQTFAAKWRGADMSDLIQAACEGLARAVDKFDHRKGYQFSTYAIWWIRAFMRREYKSSAEMVHVPPTTANHVGHKHGTPQTKYGRGMGAVRRAASLDVEVSDGLTYKDILPDNSDGPEELARRGEVFRLLKHLHRRERAIVLMRAHGRLLDDIGRVFGISRERVRQIEAKAIDKLRARFAA